MATKKVVNMEEYYSSLQNMPLPVFSKHLKRKTKCRVCLQDGDMPITSLRNCSEIMEALNVFGNIEIEDDDESPTCLCYVCYKFLKSAMLVRKVAQRTNETLNQPTLKEDPLETDDNDFDNMDSAEDDKSNLLDSIKEEGFKYKKKRRKAKSEKAQCPICKKFLLNNNYFKIHMQLH